MTLEEANELLGMARANYEYAFRRLSEQDCVALVQSWAFGLQDLPSDIVWLSFLQLTTTSEYLPRVAEIRAQARHLYFEAKEKLDFEASMQHMQRELGEPVTPCLDDKRRKQLQYIVQCTEHLSRETGTGLSLSAAFGEGLHAAIGSGEVGFERSARALPRRKGSLT